MPRYDISTRAQALTLRISGASYEEIQRQTGMGAEVVNSLLHRANERGFDPQVEHPVIIDRYLEDTSCRRSLGGVILPSNVYSGI